MSATAYPSKRPAPKPSPGDGGPASATDPSRWRIVAILLREAFVKLNPVALLRNPVLFLLWCGAALTTLVAIGEAFVGGDHVSGGTTMPAGFSWTVAAWLWITLYAANIAEALAEGRGRAQTKALRQLRDTTLVHRVHRYHPAADPGAHRSRVSDVDSIELALGDIVVLTAGDVIPADGVVVWGVASVDESAITGESAPVIRESGGNRDVVTGGTRVLSDRIVVRVTTVMGQTAVDRMIRLAEGARRQKAPNELALGALLASFSISFVLVGLTLNVIVSPVAGGVSIPVLVAMVTCLIPTEIAALLSVTGIAGMYRLLQHKVLLDSGHALETAGSITTVLLDKTGTVTRGNRLATRFVPAEGVSKEELMRAAGLASLEDPTSEGVSTVALAESLGFVPEDETWLRHVPFTAQTRMSGCDLSVGDRVRKGAETAIFTWLKQMGAQPPREVVEAVRAQAAEIAGQGGTPLVVAVKPADGPGRVLGTIGLDDVVKPGIADRIGQLRRLGISTVMVTGDNPLTAKTVAAQAGVDDYVGDATPEAKLALITREQQQGHFVAMTGDGTNDAPALAQADIGVAMNASTAAAKEAANMIILDDDPAKLVDIIEIGRVQMATRGALTTFNIANDLVRYVALFPALFVGTFPGLASLNVLGLHSPASAILSTMIFGVVVIALLIPLALIGVPYRLTNLAQALSRNLLIYGLGGIIVPVIGIVAIDHLVRLLPGY